MSFTVLRLPAAIDPTGAPVSLDWRIRLVDEQRVRVAAVHVTGQPGDEPTPVSGWATGAVEATATEPGSLPLIPQSELATPDGRRTWWELRLRPGSFGQVDTWYLSVPVSDVPLSLTDLVSAYTAAPDPVALLVARIAALEARPTLPDPGPAGQILVSDGESWNAQKDLPIE